MGNETAIPPAVRLLAEPLRWRLLGELAGYDRRVSELVVALGAPQNLVSYHLRQLRTGGLVTARRSSFDARETYYQLDLTSCADALAATGALNIWVAVILLLAAAVAGDAVNYAIGRSAGLRLIELSKTHPTWRRWINPDYIARAHDFFERQGGKAIVLGRFMPIVRTFVPFVAGVAEMSYALFALYNVTGAIAWVGICIGAGYLFGNVPVVKNNFSFVAIGIVIVSVLPMVVEYLKYRSAGKAGTS